MDSTLTTSGRTAASGVQARGQTGWFAGRQGRRLREALLAYLFLLPAFIIIGTFGLFTTLFLLFIRFLPMICMFEVKAVLPEADPHHGGKH